MSTPSAAWPVDTLVQSLGRAKWGALDGGPNKGARTVLEGLVKLLPHGSAVGRTTALQLADATGLTERWVRHCLRLLEDLGVIHWRRGGVRGARPVPSTITIIKARLAAMILDARKALKAADAGQHARRRSALTQRLQDAGRLTLWAVRRRPQPEVSTAPSFHREVTAPTAADGRRPTSSPTTGDDMLPHALREFVGPRADYITDDQERRILRAEERVSLRFPGISEGDARMRTWTLRRDVEAILGDDHEPSLSPEDGSPLDWTVCDECTKTRRACETIPARISGHTFTPRKVRTR